MNREGNQEEVTMPLSGLSVGLTSVLEVLQCFKPLISATRELSERQSVQIQESLACTSA